MSDRPGKGFRWGSPPLPPTTGRLYTAYQPTSQRLHTDRSGHLGSCIWNIISIISTSLIILYECLISICSPVEATALETPSSSIQYITCTIPAAWKFSNPKLLIPSECPHASA
ncbi:hypothetical protein BDV59DRAFT_100493 [Aspergillus ambiguus]|uniref:uncharacterized protein n=1 Tax=Aspergillus ambiguus TaxID=176160 RepID=UPI003CCDEED4